MGHGRRYKDAYREHQGQKADSLHSLAVVGSFLKPLLEDDLKLASENNLGSQDQEPAFVESRLEPVGEVHGLSAHAAKRRA